MFRIRIFIHLVTSATPPHPPNTHTHTHTHTHSQVKHTNIHTRYPEARTAEFVGETIVTPRFAELEVYFR